MAAAANYAWVNRSSMTFLVRQAFAKQFGREPDDLDMHVVYDVSHNIAKVCVGLVVVSGFSALQCCGFTVSHLESSQDMRCCAINLVPWSRRLRLSECTAHFGLVVWMHRKLSLGIRGEQLSSVVLGATDLGCACLCGIDTFSSTTCFYAPTVGGAAHGGGAAEDPAGAPQGQHPRLPAAPPAHPRRLPVHRYGYLC
jgi:hypothetical protein